MTMYNSASEPPTSNLHVGDLRLDAASHIIARWNGSAWVDVGQPTFCRRGHVMTPGSTRCLTCHPWPEGRCRICDREEDTRNGLCLACTENAGSAPTGPRWCLACGRAVTGTYCSICHPDRQPAPEPRLAGRLGLQRIEADVRVDQSPNIPEPPAGSGWRREGNRWVNTSDVVFNNIGPLRDGALRYGQNPSDQLARCRQCGNEIDARNTRPRDLRNGFCSQGCSEIFSARLRATSERERREEPGVQVTFDPVWPTIRAWWDEDANRPVPVEMRIEHLGFTEASAVGLGAQLWVGGPRRRAPSREHWNKIENDGGFAVKPRGGLWTSSFVPDKGSGWTEWCLAEDFNVPQGGWASWLLFPASDAQVLRIHTYEDLKAIVESEYGRDEPWRSEIFEGHPRWLNFEKLAERFDAIWLTEEGQGATRLSSPHNLYGWDAESVLWLQWNGIDWDKTQSLGMVRWGQPPEPPIKPRRLRGPRRRF